ncbi:hypothetical protein SteCoe_9504 [Stentor coeruleus]|uniref:Uncharacterized protein n=1 Tax=Stentor coeruleus TaxID=5963 RepID=A0A1R2CHS8_9CILI|nr:hypothetical protein SteCoe_9504 [Stentor coeruleus]
MESPFISQGYPSVNDGPLDAIEEQSFTSSSSDDEIDEDELKKKITGRRGGSMFRSHDFRKTRAEIVKEVNSKLLPVIHITFVYVVVLTCVYWLAVLAMPPFYVRTCDTDKNYSLTVFFSCFLLFTCGFEYIYAKRIVKIIEPLSGHSRLGNMQIIKLGLGLLGKLNLYTKYTFVLVAHKCDSQYAWVSTALVLFWVATLLVAIGFNYIVGGVNFLQLTEYGTLFDILGKYEIMYLEGEKSNAHQLMWTKRLCVLPVMKLFCQDIGLFIIQVLFLMELKFLSAFVLISLIVSIVLSVASVSMLYVKYRLLSPNLDKEQVFLHCVSASINEDDSEKMLKLLGTPRNFRKFGHEIRAEVFKTCAKKSFDLFDLLVTNYIVKNDGLLQSDTFHVKLINTLRNCKEYPKHLIRSLHHLTNEKNIYLNINKRIRISTGGTILHCLVEDPCFILRSLNSQNFDLIKYVDYLGIDVNITDKFEETALTLVARLNLNTLIRSCSTKKLMELFTLNGLRMNKEELDHSLKLWALNVVEFLVSKGANLTHQNKKKMNALQIGELAGNEVLCNYLFKQFGIEPEKRRRTTHYSMIKPNL